MKGESHRASLFCPLEISRPSCYCDLRFHSYQTEQRVAVYLIPTPTGASALFLKEHWRT